MRIFRGPVTYLLTAVVLAQMCSTAVVCQEGRPTYGRAERRAYSETTREVDGRKKEVTLEERRQSEEAKRKADLSRKVDRIVAKPELNRPPETRRQGIWDELLRKIKADPRYIAVEDHSA